MSCLTRLKNKMNIIGFWLVLAKRSLLIKFLWSAQIVHSAPSLKHICFFWLMLLSVLTVIAYLASASNKIKHPDFLHFFPKQLIHTEPTTRLELLSGWLEADKEPWLLLVWFHKSNSVIDSLVRSDMYWMLEGSAGLIYRKGAAK